MASLSHPFEADLWQSWINVTFLWSLLFWENYKSNSITLKSKVTIVWSSLQVSFGHNYDWSILEIKIGPVIKQNQKIEIKK